MKSRTSFFNPTVLRKDITRYSPIWGLYSVVCLLFLVGMATDRDASRFAREIVYLMPAMTAVNGIYAGVCALFLFGDLFNTRLCNALHAMPIRREGWFLTHAAAGLLFCIVPNTLAACLACLWLGSYFYMAFIWLAVAILQFVFFFGVGIFSAMCAGNRLGMAAIYGIINFFSLIVYVIVDSLFMPMLIGLRLSSDLFEFLCPMLFMTQEEYVNVHFDYDNMTMLWKGFMGEQWLYLGICAGLGLVFGGLGLLVYRKRKLEYAGDFLALKWLSPVFLIIYTLGVAVICYQIGRDASAVAGLLFLAVGLIVGFFTGRMFLERKVNVFKPKAFLGFGIFAVALVIAMGLTWLDPAGLTRYVPERKDIETVYLYDHTVVSRVYMGGSYGHGVTVTEPGEVEEMTTVHKSLVRKKTRFGDMTITLAYKLKDGRTIYRYYDLNAGDTEGQTLKPYFSRWEYVFNSNVWSRAVERTHSAMINNYAGDRTIAIGNSRYLTDYKSNGGYYVEFVNGDTTPLVELMEAIRRDCDEGNMAQPFEYCVDGDLGWIELHLSSNDVLSIRYTTEATHTVACINDLMEQAEKLPS